MQDIVGKVLLLSFMETTEHHLTVIRGDVYFEIARMFYQQWM